MYHRYFKLKSNFSTGFVPHIDQLFDEEVLIGKGWTTKESLRPLAYSTLADLVHHVRTHLPLPHLSLAVHMFSKNVHDDSLPVSIQTMSCKVSENCQVWIKYCAFFHLDGKLSGKYTCRSCSNVGKLTSGVKWITTKCIFRIYSVVVCQSGTLVWGGSSHRGSK